MRKVFPVYLSLGLGGHGMGRRRKEASEKISLSSKKSKE